VRSLDLLVVTKPGVRDPLLLRLLCCAQTLLTTSGAAGNGGALMWSESGNIWKLHVASDADDRAFHVKVIITESSLSSYLNAALMLTKCKSHLVPHFTWRQRSKNVILVQFGSQIKLNKCVSLRSADGLQMFAEHVLQILADVWTCWIFIGLPPQVSAPWRGGHWHVQCANFWLRRTPSHINVACPFDNFKI